MNEYYFPFNRVGGEFYNTLDELFGYKQSTLFLGFSDSDRIKVFERSAKTRRASNPETEYSIDFQHSAKVYSRVPDQDSQLRDLEVGDLVEMMALVSNVGRQALDFAYPEGYKTRSLRLFRHFNETTLGRGWTPAANLVGSRALRVAQDIELDVITKDLGSPRVRFLEHELALEKLSQEKGWINPTPETYIDKLEPDIWYGFPDNSYITSKPIGDHSTSRFEVVIETHQAKSETEIDKDFVQKALKAQLPAR